MRFHPALVNPLTKRFAFERVMQHLEDSKPFPGEPLFRQQAVPGSVTKGAPNTHSTLAWLGVTCISAAVAVLLLIADEILSVVFERG